MFSWALDPIVLPGASAARGQAAAFNPSRVVNWNTAAPGESGAAAHALAPNGDSIQSGDLGNKSGHRSNSSVSSNETGLSERPLVQALEALSLWPPELSQDDKSEIFHGLLIPSGATARAVMSGRSSMRNGLTRGTDRWQVGWRAGQIVLVKCSAAARN